MAAKHYYRQGFLLLLFNFISTAALEKTFSDLKRCADEECSMLLCRGKAVRDFSGPDCRFLSVKKSETIYVYYKLAGRRADVWAGSVGSNFGYFPVDVIDINHRYTDKELEIPTEETDFVCFDTGFDKFNNYDLSSLLGSSVEESDVEKSDEIQAAEELETQPSEEEMMDSEKETEHQDLDIVPDDEKDLLYELDEDTKLPFVDEAESDAEAAPEVSSEKAEEEEVESETKETSSDPEVEPVPKDEFPSVSVSEGAQIPELKTTFGTTFDAVTTDEDITTKVTPYDEEEEEEHKEEEEEPTEEHVDLKNTPLLSFFEETTDSQRSEAESVSEDESPSEKEPVSISVGAQIPKLKTTFGTTFDAVTTDEDITTKVTPYDEEEEKETEEGKEAETHVMKETPLLTFSEENMDIPASEVESVSKDEIPVENVPVSVSKESQIHKVKTTYGTTFDAVVTDEDVTTKVTPYEEEEESEEEQRHVEDHGDAEDTPLLSFSEETVGTPASEAPPEKPQTPDEKNMWTTFGDAVFSVVTGGERTPEDIQSSEEDDDDDDDEEQEGGVTKEIPRMFEEVEKDVEEPPQIESPKEPENVQHVPRDLSDSSSRPDTDEDDGEVVGLEEASEENLKLAGDPATVSQEDPSAASDIEHVEHKEEEEKSEDLEDSVVQERIGDSGNILEENKTDDVVVSSDAEPQEDIFSKDDQIQPDLTLVEPETHEEAPTDEEDEEKESEPEEVKAEQGQELLEDENALLSSQSDHKDPPEPHPVPPPSTPQLEYSDSVLRLTMLRAHFTMKEMSRLQRHLGLKNLYKVEAMFTDLETEMRVARLAHTGTTHEIESELESILEASENNILDEVENMLDSKSSKDGNELNVDTGSLDEETQILDDFQEMAFSLRQKYSTASDSTPLAKDKDDDKDGHQLTPQGEMPYSEEEDSINVLPEPESEDNVTETHHEETPEMEAVEEPIPVVDVAHSGPDVSVEEETGGHFNKNKENQPGFSTTEDIQKVPQATLEKPVDVGLGVDVEHLQSGSLDSMDPVSELHEAEDVFFSAGVVDVCCVISLIKNKIVEWTTLMISLLPDEWKPGDTLYGCPWQAVVITALAGVLTVTMFFWRTVLAVKKKEYLVDEKQLAVQLQSLKKEKEDALVKISELQKQTGKLKENQKQSKETASSTVKKLQNLESKVLEAQSRNQKMAEEKNRIVKLLEEERASSMGCETRIEKLEKSNEKLQLNKKKIQEMLAKTTALLDEAKIREDARNVQHKCLEKDYSAIKEENKAHKVAIKGWEDKHKELSEQIKSYQKSQKEMEDSCEQKDHTIEVLSELLTDLDACDLQKGDKLLANGEIVSDKKATTKNRIKELMDISRVHTTLTVVEEQRDRFMTKLKNEEQSRKALEEQHQELEHAIASLKSEKSHIESQFKVLQQKNEIMVEMYQQKENALQQKLTKEELERRSKESLLTEVGGKALEAEEQVKILRLRIHEMEDQMKKTEEVYKEQIKEQENKTHSNWVNARNAERALNQEKLEASKLREKLAVMSSQLNERRSSLFRPNSGQHAGPRQGDSYAPSPVSGGAPSPPPMIEGPRRPPSAPVGRRIDAYGPRPPSDPHGRYADIKHISGMDMMGPRSSSPANLDASQTQAVETQLKAEAQAEASTESPEPASAQGPGSFLVSPIRDSSATMVHGPPPPGPGPHDPMLPLGPHGRLPPPGPYRGPRPGPYHLPPGPLPPNLPPPIHGGPLPPNGHPGLPPPGPMGGDFGPRPINGHAYPPMPGPRHVMDPLGLPPHIRPPLQHPYRPLSPPQSHRGPMGPRPLPPDMRYPGPRDHVGPPLDLPPGSMPPHHQHPGHVLQNSAGPPNGPGQDLHPKQEATQDSARPAVVKP